MYSIAIPRLHYDCTNSSSNYSLNGQIGVLELFKPPTPKDCGSPDCPPVTSPRVQISDRRYLAYKEGSVANEKEKHIIIIVHGFNSSKDLMLPISNV
ncbi:hypothetical protein KY284_022658 [Solanum tuberosum]|nr:hypothetical protein KY284_022658 [Solanum tuberosum]